MERCGYTRAGAEEHPKTAVDTPCVSSVSRVRGMSRMDLIPADTTITGVRESSSRSLDMSRLSSPPLCTPPVPPGGLQ